MSIKSTKANQAKENSLCYNLHSKYTLDGRVYNSEAYAGPLSPRKEMIKVYCHNDKVSATDIYNMERFLEGDATRRRSSSISKSDRDDIINRYNLTYNANAHRWMGDEKIIYDQLCEKYPHAVKYKKYKGLLYAIKYGDAPCEIITTRG